MIIGGLQKTSAIDYPGKVSCVIFCAGCNFHCPYCHNADLLTGNRSPYMSYEAFFDFLEKRRGFLEAVVITGGEPSLGTDLPDLCKDIKRLGMAVKLDTNGSRPSVVSDLLEKGLVDYLAMDVKTVPEKYPGLLAAKDFDPENIRRSINIIKASGLDYEFRTTCVKPFVDEDILKQIARLVAGAPLYVLQKCRLENVLSPEFFDGIAGYTDQDLEAFRDLTAETVERCFVR